MFDGKMGSVVMPWPGQAVTGATAGEFSGHSQARAEVTLSDVWRYSSTASDVSSE